MLQVIQNVRNKRLETLRVPDPMVRPGEVLIANACSVISAGTERMVIDLARKSLLGKARQRPDLARAVIAKLRREGFFSTLRQVFAKLDEPIALGYSSAGVVLAAGEGVEAFSPGDRVASNGPHASIVSVPKHLCAAVGENVPFEHAAFTVIGAFALEGLRLSNLRLGETAVVIGLGLVGQVAVALLKAQGCVVIGTDPDQAKCALALEMGADEARTSLTGREVLAATRQIGADAVLITAATKSNQPVALAGEVVRKKGRVVVVGAVGMSLPRQPYYLKEAELVVSCSYGAGRYDPLYERRGQDYPPAYARWTEQRNMQAVLDMMGAGRLDVGKLITHRFDLDSAELAYEMIESQSEPYLGIVLRHGDPADTPAERVIELKASAPCDKIAIGCLGAGGFASAVLIPAIKKVDSLHRRVICSAGGLSATIRGRKSDFDLATSDADQVFADPQVGAVFIMTRHNLHASQVCKALRAGKAVFVEKPLAMTIDELAEIESTLSETGGLLTVGFNRRFSPAAAQVKDYFKPVSGPITVSIRFNCGALPAEHWTQDAVEGGGRIIGEACHAIDLATYLANSVPVSVYAESIGGPDAPATTDDQCFISLRHANGSISSIAYLAGGSGAFAKERIEVLGGGKMAVIDDFTQVSLAEGAKVRTTTARSQDKGHQAEVEAFATCLSKGAQAPIPWNELHAVSLASILAVRSMREGLPFGIPATLSGLEACEDD